jgi:hypothetical protein
VNSIVVDHAPRQRRPEVRHRLPGAAEPHRQPDRDADQHADRCTTPTNIGVRLEGPLPGDVCKSAKKQIKIVTLSMFQGGKLCKDTDKLKLTCDPPVPASPA